jgi:penicillin-binding protein 2
MDMTREIKNLHLEKARFHTRLRVGLAFLLVLTLILFARLVYLQVFERARYATLAESNRITLVPIPAPRGRILDRNGAVLAENFSGYTVELTPSKMVSLDATLAEIARLIEVSPRQKLLFRRLLAESHEFESVPLKSKLTDAEVGVLLANRYRLPGVEVRARLFRNYPAGTSLAHVVGYIGRINDRDLARIAARGETVNYKGNTHIGKVGLEEYYETILHGRTGFDQVETDAHGRAVRILARVPPVPGRDLVLNLDLGMQKVAEHAFGEYRGAMIALDVQTGGVLAMVSKPGFDPNLFVDGIDTATWKELNESIDTPMVNRALRGGYPPGSTIKPFLALGALELGLRRPEDGFQDPGFYSLPNSRHRYRDWKPSGHGWVDMHQAIVQSCDTYYYRLAVDMGIDRMHDFLAPLGFGQKTGIDLSGEFAGILPSKQWKQQRWKKPWYVGETVIAGIGQGYHVTTPLQLAAATASLANGQQYHAPRLVREVRSEGAQGGMAPTPGISRPLNYRPAHLDVVRTAMEDVLRPGGTAVLAGANAPYRIAGKTGTAQVVSIKQGARYDASRTAERHRDHALFVAFAPAEAPRIAVAVMVENGGHGGSTAAPMARAVFDYALLGLRPAAMADGAVPTGQPPDQGAPPAPVLPRREVNDAPRP